MLRILRYNLAVNVAIDRAAKRGAIANHKQKTMVKIGGSTGNRQFGVAALKMGAASTPAAAAGAVFARLARVSERNPIGDVTTDDWTAVTRQTFLNGGVNEVESFLLTAELIAAMDDQSIGS